jgi:hypothetical protein
MQAKGAVVKGLGDLGGKREAAGPDQVQDLLPDLRDGCLFPLGLGHRAGEPAELGAIGAVTYFLFKTIKIQLLSCSRRLQPASPRNLKVAAAEFYEPDVAF